MCHGMLISLTYCKEVHSIGHNWNAPHQGRMSYIVPLQVLAGWILIKCIVSTATGHEEGVLQKKSSANDRFIDRRVHFSDFHRRLTHHAEHISVRLPHAITIRHRESSRYPHCMIIGQDDVLLTWTCARSILFDIPDGWHQFHVSCMLWNWGVSWKFVLTNLMVIDAHGHLMNFDMKKGSGNLTTWTLEIWTVLP
jgi:hypothetical protein